MVFTGKSLLGLASLAGVSKIIGIPVALTIQRKSREIADNNSQKGVSSQISINLCTTLKRKGSNTTIDFGNQQSENVCWDVSPNSPQPIKDQEYTTFFRDQWNKKNMDWNDHNSHGRWQKQCDGAPSPWVIFSPINGDHYLGFCDNKDLKNTLFAKKRQNTTNLENPENWTLWICNDDCWETNQGTISTSTTVLEKEKTDNWKTVIFQLQK